MVYRLFLVLLLASSAFAQNLASKLDAHVLSYVSQGRFSGSVLVAQGGKPVLSRGYGYADREWDIANTPDTKFRLGSITKQFTAMLILQLQQRGRLSVNDPVNKYVPDPPPAWQKITIHHLLSHTSGIPNFTSFPDYQKTMHAPSPPADTLARFRNRPLDFEPGSQWRYSNSGYVLLGYIIEKVTGRPYADVLREFILGPLEMEDSGYDMPQTLLKRRASGYAPGWKNAEYLNMTIPHAAGAMYSTILDLLKWDQALYTEKLLPSAALAKMFTEVKSEYALRLRGGTAGFA